MSPPTAVAPYQLSNATVVPAAAPEASPADEPAAAAPETRPIAQAVADSSFRVFPKDFQPSGANPVLSTAKTKKYQFGDMSFTLAENIGATLLDLNLGGNSLLWSPITDGCYTSKLGGAGSVGSASVWPAGRVLNDKNEYKINIPTGDGVIDLETERKAGLIPSDGNRLGMHGLGFTSPHWKVSEPRREGDFMVVDKSLKFDSDPSLAKFGDKGQLDYTHKVGKNQAGNKVFRTSINANTTDPHAIAYLSSLAEHYFFKGDANTVVSSTATTMHNSGEEDSPSRPELPKSGFGTVVGTKYNLTNGVKIIGDGKRREAILGGFLSEKDSRGFKEVARIEQANHTLVIRQKATLDGQYFSNGILVFADPKKMTDRFCVEPYFGFINGQNRVFANKENGNVQALTVGKGHGEFNAEIEIELIPNK